MKKSTHPKIEQWWEWIIASEADSSLESHLDACEECAELVETLRDLRRARRSTRFLLPPRSILQRAVQGKKQMAPGLPASPMRSAKVPVDVRGGASEDPTQPRTVTGNVGEARISVAISPRVEDQIWQFRGIVTGQPDSTSIQVLLVHDDHILAAISPSEDGTFALDEPAPQGWSLEIRKGDDAWVIPGPTE
ncbi:MAG: hypothetical protein R3E12_13750 [Candidatus Eisenbacteria bacterium]|uniref:Zinc-finger domain-containing protein n=1 Tax=Eiseniibacteriota bacterium TaxID=2212470 RepID=A0A956LZ06_UNCEI|nr:hypothetical protein [Candidatus Eisenbacteria bacterium]